MKPLQLILTLLLGAAFSWEANAHDVSERQITSAYQLIGLVLADTNLVTREWSKYQIFQPNLKGFRGLPQPERYRLLHQMYEDISVFLGTSKDHKCSDFFAPPSKMRALTWASRRFAQSAAIYMANPKRRDDWVRRGVEITSHKRAEHRYFTEQSIAMHQAWDDLCFNSDMTVQEVAYTYSNSPEAFEPPKWKINKKFALELEARFLE